MVSPFTYPFFRLLLLLLDSSRRFPQVPGHDGHARCPRHDRRRGRNQDLRRQVCCAPFLSSHFPLVSSPQFYLVSLMLFCLFLILLSLGSEADPTSQAQARSAFGCCTESSSNSSLLPEGDLYGSPSLCTLSIITMRDREGKGEVTGK